MKVEIDSEELKRLRSREEKYLAYMNMLSYRGEDETYVDALCGRVAELEEENRKLREELEHYKNTEAIQKSNAESRYKYPSTSYVDRIN